MNPDLAAATPGRNGTQFRTASRAASSETSTCSPMKRWAMTSVRRWLELSPTVRGDASGDRAHGSQRQLASTGRARLGRVQPLGTRSTGARPSEDPRSRRGCVVLERLGCTRGLPEILRPLDDLRPLHCSRRELVTSCAADSHLTAGIRQAGELIGLLTGLPSPRLFAAKRRGSTAIRSSMSSRAARSQTRPTARPSSSSVPSG